MVLKSWGKVHLGKWVKLHLSELPITELPKYRKPQFTT